MLMNVRLMKQTNAIPTPSAPSLKDPMYVAVFVNSYSEAFSPIKFTDMDECASPASNECDPNALCTNTEGSYVCRCLSGYIGDGANCTGESNLQMETKEVYCV